MSRFTMTIDWEDFGQLNYFYNSGVITDPLDNIDRQTSIILDLFSSTGTKATFFILGMLAKSKPGLVKKIKSHGHEIALHGNNHLNFLHLDRIQAKKDIEDGLKLVEDISGSKIFGFRAPFFSINESNLFVLEILSEMDFLYDSSIFPMKLPRYGIRGFDTRDSLINFSNGGKIVELPMSIYETNKFSIPISGGGYFRVLPYFLLNYFFRKISESDGNAMIYMHPYEFDNELIRFSDNFPKEFKISFQKIIRKNIYWNLFRNSIIEKIHKLSKQYTYITCQERAQLVLLNRGDMY